MVRSSLNGGLTRMAVVSNGSFILELVLDKVKWVGRGRKEKGEKKSCVRCNLAEKRGGIKAAVTS